MPDSCEYLDNGCPADFSIHLLLPHETSCRRFYYCANGQKIPAKCAAGQVFNPYIQNCDRPGSIDRTCEEEDSSSESDESLPNDDTSVEIDRHPNGCPVDSSISGYLPHEYYCNLYYQCNFGSLIERRCAAGTHFNPAVGYCDHISVVQCTLPGGDADLGTVVTPEAPTTAGPPSDLLPNGCPADGSDWLLPHEDDCSKFYFCVHGGLLVSICPSGLHFSPAYQRCESPAVAGCFCKNKDCSGESESDSSEQPAVTTQQPATTTEQPTTTTEQPTTTTEQPAPTTEQPAPTTEPPAATTEQPAPTTEPPAATTEQPTTATEQPTNTTEPPTTTTEQPTNTTELPTTTTEQPTNTTEPPTTTTEQPTNTTELPTTTTEQPTNTTELPTTTTEQPTNTTEPPATTTEQPTNTTEPPTTTTEQPTNTTEPPTTTTEQPTNTTEPPTTTTEQPTNTTEPPPVTTEEPAPVSGESDNDSSAADDSGCYGPGCDTNISESREDPISEEDDDIPPAGDDSGERPPSGNKCEEDCHVLPWAHGDCDKYWKCEGNTPKLVVCSEGLHFNPNTYTCDFACNVGCVRRNIQTTSGPDGLRVYIPWSQIDNRTKALLKLLTK